MSTLLDFALGQREDGTLVFSMIPPTNIENWTIQYTEMHRFGGISGLVIKSTASGYNGVSGINITNPTQGIMNISIASIDSSGRDYGCYAFSIQRLDSGAVTILSEGYRLITPNT